MGYRHLARYKEIINILGKHGLGFLLGQLGLKRVKAEASLDVNILTTAERIRLALEELGPTFIKLGQLLSIRPDLLPKDFIVQLELLQDKVQSIPYEKVSKVMQEELGADVTSIFSSFEEQPIASASIGQVHKGTLLTGESVVVKVQRPGVRRQVEVDLTILFDLARLAEKRTKWGAHYKLVDIAEELARTITEELDYSIEGRNGERLAEYFAKDETVKFPKIYWDYTSKRVLMMEYVKFAKINNFNLLKEQGYNNERIVENLTTALLKQIYLHGFFHADPHPGNLGVLPGEVILFMDFGMVGRLDEDLRERFVAMILAIISKDVNGIIDILMEIGVATRKVNRQSLKKDITRLMDRYYYIPLSQLKLGDILQEMLSLAFVYKVKIPVEVTLVAKSLITLESIVQQLDTNISIVNIAEAFGKILVKNRYAPNRVKRDVIQYLLEFVRFTRSFPKRFDNLLGLLEDGDFKVQLEHKSFDNFTLALNVIGNRISFAIVIAALIIGSSLVARNSQFSFLLKLPIAEIGFVSAVILGIWLLISILRSGRI